jgi:hypothetical protein
VESILATVSMACHGWRHASRFVSAGLSEHVTPDRPLAVHIFDCASQLDKIDARLRLLAPADVNMTVTKTAVC